MIDESLNLSWYLGGTLLENLDALVPPKRPFGRPLRLPVQDVYEISGIKMHPTAPPEAVPGDINRRYVVGEMARDPLAQYLGFTARMTISNDAVYQPVFDCGALLASSLSSFRGLTAGKRRRSSMPKNASRRTMQPSSRWS
jgi:elongation factor 1-alpha